VCVTHKMSAQALIIYEGSMSQRPCGRVSSYSCYDTDVVESNLHISVVSK